MLACNPKEVDPSETSSVILEFDNRVGAQKLALGTTTYQNAGGEAFTVTTLNYFISNVALRKADGSVIQFPDQYFLIRQADAATWEPELKDVPLGDYNAITFTIGVDSARSASEIDARTGVLDITSYGTDGMYWSWNSGYIFMKLEGTSPVAPLNSAGQRAFQYHVGGYGGYTSPAPNNLRTVTLPITDALKVSANKKPTVHLIANLLKVFDGSTPLRLAQTHSVHSPAAAGPIANNYVQMFSVDHVHN